MTLSTAYLLTGIALAVPGAALISGLAPVHAAFRAFPRSFVAALVFFGGAAAWFLWGINQLSESDLAGFPRGGAVAWFLRKINPSIGSDPDDFPPLGMLEIFGVTALLAFKFLRDLLAVRGLAILLLLSARALLDAGYMQQPANLLLSSTSYFFIVLGILWGVSPYRFRDWLDWTLNGRKRSVVVGAAIAALGVANIVAAVATR